VAAFGANGVLGVGPFLYDCGTTCATSAIAGAYYSCSGTTCTATMVPVADQVQSVIAKFSSDNNGIIIDMPQVAAGGALSVSGTMTFGIDTQSDNASGSETVITLDNFAEFSATFLNQTLAQSFIDSGTNGTYFSDVNLANCTQSGITSFFCPASTQSLSATITGANSMSTMIDFNVGDAAQMLQANPNFTAFPDLAGSYPANTPTLDFGLPFFYGRRVAVAMEGKVTAVGTGPYVAF
jgi:hypothetical protein